MSKNTVTATEHSHATLREYAREDAFNVVREHPVFASVALVEKFDWSKAARRAARQRAIAAKAALTVFVHEFERCAVYAAEQRAANYRPVVSSAQVQARRDAGVLDPEAPLFVSYGLGVDSTAMLVGMAARGVIPDAITFADTGSEKPETYEFLPVMNAWLRDHGMPEVTVVRYGTATAKDGNGTYSTLEEQLLLLGTLPGIVFGFGSSTYGKSCSQKWKVGPQERHDRHHPVAQQGWFEGRKVTRCIGYDCGAADSKRSDIPEDERYQYWYPLRTWGWDRERCKSEIELAGLPLPPKSACWFCPATKADELREFVARHPEYVPRILAIEAAAAPSLDRSVEGLWAKPCKGTRNAEKAHPGSWTEFLTGSPLDTIARTNRINEEQLISANRLNRKSRGKNVEGQTEFSL
jgi:hypothetical protein